MSLKLKTPEEKEFQLLVMDPTGETHVRIRQATQREHEMRAELWATASRVIRDGGGGEMELKQRISFPEIMRREVYLTITECNITKEDDTPLFTFRKDNLGRSQLTMSEAAFGVAWGLLTPEMAAELHSKVLEVNPSWGAVGES